MGEIFFAGNHDDARIPVRADVSTQTTSSHTTTAQYDIIIDL